ncbi:hypothetical protein NP233_g6024 [Leucocoprinus birnbaumii]|uniref:Uncharacterized protein n=1 Tax=Leucocoprinus birnbaumii TaxID=56174 RepID=A0AAD5VT01_9AGAR|nr:hypothetical protein NP233_g6024 [Leucocoprinus birnbaumii]
MLPPGTKLPCSHPLSQATTIAVDDQEDTLAIEINSLSLQSSDSSLSSTVSNPPTLRSSPSVITEDDVLTILEDPLSGLGKALFSIAEESLTSVHPVDTILPSLSPIDDPIIQHLTPSTSPIMLNTTSADQSDPIQGVASLSLTDEDSEGSMIRFDMTEQEGQA